MNVWGMVSALWLNGMHCMVCTMYTELVLVFHSLTEDVSVAFLRSKYW